MLTPKASSRPTKTSPRLIAAPRRPALASRKPARGPGRDRRPTQPRAHAESRPRRRTSSSVAPIQSSAGAKNM